MEPPLSVYGEEKEIEDPEISVRNHVLLLIIKRDTILGGGQ